MVPPEIVYSEPSRRTLGSFADVEPFDGLASLVLPRLLDRRRADPLRIWVAGCATGEDVYAIAISLLEQLDHHASSDDIRIFATDVDDSALDQARKAIYPYGVERTLSRERVQRFFTRTDHGLHIQRAVRDLVVFAHHDLHEDPPFSRIDVVSCRHLLPALSSAQRRTVLAAFHYALRPDAYLLLGDDESVGDCELFTRVDSRTALYARRSTRPAAGRAAIAGDQERAMRELESQQRTAERDARLAYASEQMLRRRVQRIESASAEVTAALATLPASDLRPLYQVIVDQARRVAEAELAGLGLGNTWGRPFDPWVVSGATAERAAAFARAPRSLGLLGAVLHAGRAIRVRNAGDHAPIADLPGQPSAIASFLGVPIRYHGDSRGHLFLANRRDGGEFTEDDQMAVEMFAERAGVALEIARLRQVEAGEHTRLELLARAGPLLAEPVDYDTTLDSVTRLVVPALADFSAVGLVQADGSLTGVVAYHRDASHQRLLESMLGTVPRDRLPEELRAAIDSAQPQLRDRPPELIRLALSASAHEQAVDRLSATSTIVAPLIVHGRVVGILRLVMAESGRRYTARDVALATEVAHHAALAIERARLYSAAQSAVTARDDLLAFVTHDLHNYLATIRVSAAALTAQRAASNGADAGYRPIDLIGRTVTHMGRLIDGLRDATMLETGQFTIAAAAEDVAALIGDAIDTHAPQADARLLHLIARIADDLPLIACDRERVLQVIANLVGNAIKFTPAHGQIQIAAARIDDAVKISVSDTGPGIAAAQLPHVFDRYWRASGTTGTGLGLFIARGIVEAHGGRIWVDSTVGVGTAFHFTVPSIIPITIETR